VDRVIAALTDDRRRPLYDSVMTSLPAGAPCRKYLRGLRQLNTLYRYAAPTEQGDAEAAGGAETQPPPADEASQVRVPRRCFLRRCSVWFIFS
jgi:hypothetical protein